jgi:hypothetical protein
MKNLTLIALILLSFATAFSQETDDKQIKTIFGSVDSHGGYGAITINYTPINNKDGIFMGGRGCWVIGHGLAIGFGGGGFFNNYHYDYILNDDYHYEGGYGGIYIEPIILGRMPIHLAVPVFLGVGGIAYASRYYDSYYNSSHLIEEVSPVLVAEPGVELEFNMFKHFRLSFGVYYRYTSEISLYNTPPDLLNGFSGGLTFKFGKF